MDTAIQLLRERSNSVRSEAVTPTTVGNNKSMWDSAMTAGVMDETKTAELLEKYWLASGITPWAVPIVKRVVIQHKVTPLTIYKIMNEGVTTQTLVNIIQNFDEKQILTLLDERKHCLRLMDQFQRDGDSSWTSFRDCIFSDLMEAKPGTDDASSIVELGDLSRLPVVNSGATIADPVTSENEVDVALSVAADSQDIAAFLDALAAT
jgi:hypothetical protein